LKKAIKSKGLNTEKPCQKKQAWQAGQFAQNFCLYLNDLVVYLLPGSTPY